MRKRLAFCGLIGFAVAVITGCDGQRVPPGEEFSTGGGTYTFENYTADELKTAPLAKARALVKAKAELQICVSYYSLNFYNALLDAGYESKNVFRLKRDQIEAGQHLKCDVLILSRIASTGVTNLFIQRIREFLAQDKVLLTEYESGALLFKEIDSTLVFKMPLRLSIFDGIVGGGGPVDNPAITIRLAVQDSPFTENVAPVFTATGIDYFLTVENMDPNIEVIATFEGGLSSGFKNQSYPAIVKMSYDQSQIYSFLCDAQDNLNDPNINNLFINAIQTLTSQQNRPPIADAGPDIIIDQTDPTGALVTLDAGGSTDPDGDLLAYRWSWTIGSQSFECLDRICSIHFPIGVTPVGLSVSDGGFESLDSAAVLVNHVNHPPVANAGEDQNLSETIPDGTTIELNASASSDPDGDPLTYRWLLDGNVISENVTAGMTLKHGVYQFTVEVSDGTLTSTDDLVVTIADVNFPPVLIAADIPEMLEQQTPEGTSVLLNASASYDPDGMPLEFRWEIATIGRTDVLTTGSAEYVFPPGTSQVTLTISDGVLFAMRTATVHVADTTPPVLDVTVTPDVLTGWWPKFVRIRISYGASDPGDSSPRIWLDSVTSSYVPWLCKPKHSHCKLLDKICTFRSGIRTTRSGELFLAGGHDGRVYTLTFKAVDNSGNVATFVKTVTTNVDRRLWH